MDEEGVKLVRSHYADKKPSQPVEAENVLENVKADAKAAEVAQAEPVKAVETAEAKKEVPKKKKVIIVNNSQNSKNGDFQKNKQNMCFLLQ